MAWVAPSTRTTGTLITAAIWNQDIVDNELALRAGGIAIASQAALDILYASSATQFGRLALAALQSVRKNAANNALEAFSPVEARVVESLSSTGTVNDHSLDGRSTLLLCSNASALVITGFSVVGATPTAGDEVIVFNDGSSTVRIADDDAGSTAAYRVLHPSVRGQILGVRGWAKYVYGSGSRWKLVSVNPGNPIAIAFDAGNWSTNSTGSWTVVSGDVEINQFQQIGDRLRWQQSLSTGSDIVGGDALMKLTLPNGASWKNSSQPVNLVWVNNNSVIYSAPNTASGTSLFLQRPNRSDTWATGIMAVRFDIEIVIA